MRSPSCKLVHALWLFVLIGGTTHFSLGQGAKQSVPDSLIEEQDQDHPAARDAWFMRGRRAPNGESAALLRYRAYQQKLQLRRQAFAARAITAVPHISNSGGWSPLGPAPLASDATGTGAQDYQQVSGRATAVAIDPADATGNTVFIGGAHGGVWKSLNAGSLSPSPASVVWNPVLDYEGTLAVGAIAIQPGNTNPSQSVVLVGTGEPNSSADSYYGLGILRSTNGGQTWSPIQSANSGARSFAGLGFSKIAFNSTTGKTNVVVAAAAAAETGILFGLDTTGLNRGLYYSQDSGQTWNYASVKDGSTTIDAGSATSVVYNKAAGAFFAAMRYHGIYASTDGINWSRLANQPAGITSTQCPSVNSSQACPLYRAELAVVPGRNELYTWVVGFDSSGNEVDEGIWISTNSGASWAQIADAGITNCGNEYGCGVLQGSYNLEIAAVPNGSTATDLYAGAINLYKCTVNSPISSPSCSFLNLTHVYGCPVAASALAHVHPDQHALDALIVPGSPTIVPMYFANDGGIYRTLDGYTGLTTSDCASHNQFDSLNLTLGSMTQFVSFSVHPTDVNTLLGGTQDNGSPATASAETSTSWLNVLAGDGGFNAISPANGADWFTSNPDVPPGNLGINYCGSGINCRTASFAQVVTSGQLSGDDGAFYFPYIQDPQAPTRLIVGTCRVWRGGPATSASGTYATLSNNFDSGGTNACGGLEHNLVRSLAAGGPKDSNGYSKVIYAGTDGNATGAPPASGRVFVTTNAEVTLMSDVTGTINPDEYPVSGIALDPSDATGQTAYVTIMGFHVGHVFKTTNAGQSWTDFTGNLPDDPADAVIVDGQAGTVYVGTDVGVFSSSTATPSWSEVGPQAAAGTSGFLPNVPVTALRLWTSGTTKLLRASTYGRGIWEYNLNPVPDFQVAISNPSLTIFPTQTATFNGKLTAFLGYNSQVTLSCSGTHPSTCTPNPATLTPTTAPGAAFTITAAGTVLDYSFNVHAVGSDTSATTHDAGVMLHVVDYSLGASPSTVTAQQGAVSSSTTLLVSGLGSFAGTVTLSCPTTGMPVGVSCVFSPSNSVSVLPSSPTATVTLTFNTTSSTPTGTTAIIISATTSGAPAPKPQTVDLTVSAPTPDYSISFSNSPASATVNQLARLNGVMKALNGYASAVNLSCGSGAPPTCTVSPASVTPTTAGAPFTVTVQSSAAQTYNFNVNGAGTDAAHVAHTASAQFTSLFTFTIADTTTTQSVKAGQTAVFSLTLTPVGSTSFPIAVSFSCNGLPAGASCSNPQVSAGANGTQTVSLNISTAGLGRAAIRAVTKKQNLAPFFVWASLVGIVFGGFPRRSSSTSKGVQLALLVVSALILGSCGGGGSGGGGGGGGGGGNVVVSVTPKTASRFPTQQQQFTATVTGSTNTQVTWQVNGATGGSASAGTIDASGMYTAPVAVPAPASVTVSAVAQADVTKSDSAIVTIQSPTAAGTYTITVTATAGTVNQSTSATLVVQ